MDFYTVICITKKVINTTKKLNIMYYKRKLSSIGNCLDLDNKDKFTSSFGEVCFKIKKEVSEDTYKEAEDFPYETRPSYSRPFSDSEKEDYKNKLKSFIGKTFILKVYKDFNVDEILKEKGFVEFEDICFFAEVVLLSVE